MLQGLHHCAVHAATQHANSSRPLCSHSAARCVRAFTVIIAQRPQQPCTPCSQCQRAGWTVQSQRSAVMQCSAISTSSLKMQCTHIRLCAPYCNSRLLHVVPHGSRCSLHILLLAKTCGKRCASKMGAMYCLGKATAKSTKPQSHYNQLQDPRSWHLQRQRFSDAFYSIIFYYVGRHCIMLRRLQWFPRTNS